MKRQGSRSSEHLTRQRALLIALSDDLSLPFLQLKTSVELIRTNNFSSKATRIQIDDMALSADAGLHLIEAYRLLLKSEETLAHPFEPMAIGAVLDEVAQRLVPYARQYSTRIEVDVQGRLTPVLAHQPSLLAAFEALGSSLIRAQAAQSQKKGYQLVLGAHRAAENTVAAGAFSEVHGLSDHSLRAARGLVGRARQPLPSVPPGTASGILVADMLCAALWQPLRAAAHRSLNGLATSLPTSKQLHFV